jgi:hypothetical protein
MADFNYELLLETFGDTLEKISEDTGKQEENNIYLTASQKRIINFDKFTHSIAEEINPNNRPKSCDGLLKLNNNYYFIEFKNGRIRERQEGYEIREKILESILLFLEQINQTISYSRDNCYFVLVYNVNSAAKGSNKNGIDKIINKLDNRIHLDKYEKIYLKRTFVYTIDDFNKNFVQKHGL